MVVSTAMFSCNSWLKFANEKFPPVSQFTSPLCVYVFHCLVPVVEVAISLQLVIAPLLQFAQLCGRDLLKTILFIINPSICTG